jgi:drug/metabolite transporter (DMT)-like permease
VTAGVVALVLASALLHASWNALLKGGVDRLRSATLMTLSAGVASVPIACLLPAPRPASWGYIGLSAALHVVYNLLLLAAYRHGDLGVSYPVARGTSPLLVAAGAAATAGEDLAPPALAGIALISLGIAALAFERGRHLAERSLVAALLTGVSIASYTVVDGLGARASGDARAYAAWLFLLMGLPMPLILVASRGHARDLRLDGQAMGSVVGGIVSLVAYAIVIWAASVSPMGMVSALRETSVVFAALLGRLFLGERLGPRRLAACSVVAAGAAWLGSQHR